jgi:hypothetical protein
LRQIAAIAPLKLCRDRKSRRSPGLDFLRGARCKDAGEETKPRDGEKERERERERGGEGEGERKKYAGIRKGEKKGEKVNPHRGVALVGRRGDDGE